MATITTLTSRTSLLAKKFIDGDASQKLSMGYLFDASSVEIESLNDLARYLSWTCPVLVPHPVLVSADIRSNLIGDVPPIAECRRRAL